MRSMTGFGRFHKQTGEMDIDISIRSLNSRFLEIKIHGPKIYDFLEADIRKKVSQKIKRGFVEVFVNRRCLRAFQKIHFNKALAENWLKGFHSVAKELKLEPVKSSMLLLEIPDFIKQEEKKILNRGEKTVLFKAIDGALAQCLRIREREGSFLKKDLKGHLQDLLKQLNLIKKIRKKVLRNLDDKYRKRLGKLNLPGTVEPQRLAQEIVIQLDKSDISEEVQRLEVHIKEVGCFISTSGSLGKKLDFYAQELLREINTIGSKSTDPELTRAVVESKTLIEKYREQVQNVE